jgi:ASF1 like histone chaperone
MFAHNLTDKGGTTWQANHPDPAQLPQGEVLGITAILLTCSYNTKVRHQ